MKELRSYEKAREVEAMLRTIVSRSEGQVNSKDYTVTIGIANEAEFEGESAQKYKNALVVRFRHRYYDGLIDAFHTQKKYTSFSEYLAAKEGSKPSFFSSDNAKEKNELKNFLDMQERLFKQFKQEKPEVPIDLVETNPTIAFVRAENINAFCAGLKRIVDAPVKEHQKPSN